VRVEARNRIGDGVGASFEALASAAECAPEGSLGEPMIATVTTTATEVNASDTATKTATENPGRRSLVRRSWGVVGPLSRSPRDGIALSSN